MFYRLLITIVSLFLPAFAGSGQMPEYKLDVSFDINNSRIIGLAKIDVTAGREIILHTGLLEINDVSLNKQKISFDVRNGTLKILPAQNGVVFIEYAGVFKGGNSGYSADPGTVHSIIDERGISLTGIWYPQPDTLHRYRLSASLPKGYEAVSEAESIIKSTKNGSTEFIFEFLYPVDGINFIAANRYETIKDNFNGVEIHALFFKEDVELAKKYIEYTKKYLKMYEALLGKYPYKRFAIVENFLPTGYSMPTYTLLGRDVVRLPFIVETSLGHEILHQWFGNLVYIDYEKGNWAEGLTTYLADHLYEEQRGKGREYRKQALIDYESHVNEKNEFSVGEFAGRVDFSSKAIGYGKAAMIFHMLKNITGEEIFYRSLRDFIKEKSFKKASWEDIRVIFGKNYGRDLQWFFRQWLDEKGLPDLRLENVKVRRSGVKFEVNFSISRGEKIYVMDVPVTLYSGDMRIKKSFRADKDTNSFSMLVDREPEKIVMDEDYDIARRLSSKEFPPVIARLIGDEKILTALPPSNREFYGSAIYMPKEKTALQKEAKDIKDSDMKASSVIILGNDNPLVERLYGKPEIIYSGFSIIIKKNPWNSKKIVAIINGKSKEDVDTAFRKIFHYGKYSALAFDKGRNIYKRIDESGRGIPMNITEQATAIDVSALKTLDEIINSVSNKKIIYVGESHDQFAHHDVQLRVIKGIYSRNKKTAIGMEMFQRPFQKVLDDYIAGSIDEREFLKKSEYFKRWGFDYNLYKPILDFAKQEKIPVIALNIRREIIDKVSKNGIDALSDEEKREIPSQMDLSDDKYRERLRNIFEMHVRSKERNFEFFYQSQILWDETMSMSIDEFIKKNPEYQVVVLAGSGHLQYGSGIPKRTFRRNGHDYSVILNDAETEKDIANYIVFPKPVAGVSAPKLMVLLKEDNGKVVIDGFAEDSVAEKAGLSDGDILISIDGIEVSSVDDIKLHLSFKKKGDKVRVKALRKRFLFGDKEMEFDVTL